MNKQTTDELFSSNKQLNVKVNQLIKKVETDNKELKEGIKEINKNINILILQTRKITDKLVENKKSQEFAELYKKNKETINNNLEELNKFNHKNELN
jgi:hypothetical protein